MHIPDGYLSPQTCAAGFLVAAPALAMAARNLRKRVKTRNVPTLAMFAAVCFLIMMFNVPVPDGTTAHAVGGALVAIVLGPWAALIAVAVALAFQALLFGDGGVLAFGANVVNMGIVMPLVGLGVYRLVSRGAELTSKRRVVAAALGGYFGITAAGLATGIELGIQPLLFHDAAGTPLYAPYHLAQAVPAMLFAHLVVAGFAEAVLCATVITYLQRANLPLLRVNHPGVAAAGEVVAVAAGRRRRFRPGVVAGAVMLLMVALSPLGLLAEGTAFGEDAPEDLVGQVGLTAVPAGLARYAGFWRGVIFPDYTLSETASPALGYYVSAVVGILVVGLVIFLLGQVIQRFSARSTSADKPAEAGAMSS